MENLKAEQVVFYIGVTLATAASGYIGYKVGEAIINWKGKRDLRGTDFYRTYYLK